MKYQIKSTLQGPQDAVTSLAFTVQGKLLAAAGPGGVSVWSLATSQLVPLVSGIGGYQQPERTAFPVVAWLFYKEQSRHVLMLGSWDGQLQFWDYVDERSTLESTRQAVRHTPLAQVISVDIFPKEVPAGGRAKIVTSFADSSVSVWTLSMNGELKKKFTIKLHISFIPKAVRFDTKTNNIYVFAMNGGDIAFLDCHTGNTIWMKNGGPTVMGSISLDPTSENFAVCTSQGFELFELERISYIRKFDGEPIHIAVPKHLSFVEDGSKVLGGTDRGYAALYDVQSGKVVQKLKYSLGGLVQSVAACATNDDFFTAIAGSNGHQRCDVIVWQKPRPIPRSRHMEGNDEYVVLPIKKKSLRRFVYIAGLALSFFGYTAFVTLLSDVCRRLSHSGAFSLTLFARVSNLIFVSAPRNYV
ncbi:WD40-repeat-containing domain protein [Lentinula detonsa]|uniref:WD40-repeat-containing domain protein n=1 Tax=Lentinula detonsa TaxID=2804962 RepID=A0A9W8NY32_9AGAR|nr:WD40-repeat-containing domain protein [Lentinula detonsa]